MAYVSIIQTFSRSVVIELTEEQNKAWTGGDVDAFDRLDAQLREQAEPLLKDEPVQEDDELTVDYYEE